MRTTTIEGRRQKAEGGRHWAVRSRRRAYPCFLLSSLCLPPSAFCLLLSVLCLLSACRGRKDAFVIVLESNPEFLDPLRGTDASSERLRQLMFNSLMRKNERFEYVGELATDVQTSEDGKSVTITLRDGVTFHDGKPLTAADAKYTFDTLLASDYRKAASFFEVKGNDRQPYITGIEAPDARTLIFRLRKPWLELPANLVPIPIIPQGSAATQKDRPLGSGAFKFVRYDEAQQVVDLEASENYWEGAPNIKALRMRVILDANTLQAELRSGRVDLAVNTQLSPDAYKALAQDANLKVEQSSGSNIVYLGFNTQSEPVKDARVRQAIAYAIDREGIVRDLLLGQAKVAHSILPEESWAYAPGQRYSFDPEKAKGILDEAGYRDPDGDGPRMRFAQPISFKISASNATVRSYSSVIQNALQQVGIPVNIETLEDNTLRDAQRSGQYQMTTSRWVGGNQDLIFLRDLFTYLMGGGFNRSRYSNPEVDRLLGEAVNTADREKARSLYVQAQEIISRDLPMLPLWYPANMVVARKNVGNIKVDPSAGWGFVKNVTVDQ